MLPIVLEEQLIPGTFEYTLNVLIQKELDLSLFDKRYVNDATGAPALDPKLLLKLILFCYSKGIVSSRKIMELARTNIIAKALCADEVPHYTTIAAFISSMAKEIKSIFTQVLMVCGSMNLLDRTMFAVDGCKLPSNASKEWSGTHGDLEKKQIKLEKLAEDIIKQHTANDTASANTGKDDLIEEKRKQADRIKAKAEKVKAFLETNKKRMGSRDNEIKSNVTDNESATMKCNRGVIQGYNGIAVVDDKSQVIVAAEAFGNGQEHAVLKPMLEQTESNLKEIYGQEESLAGTTVLADTGYFSEENLKATATMNIDAVIPDQKFRQRDSRFDDRDRFKETTRKFSLDDFTHNEDENTYTCPNGKKLTYAGSSSLHKMRGKRYHSNAEDCKVCPLRSKCFYKKESKTGERTIFVRQVDGEIDHVHDMMAKIDRPEIRELYSRRMGIVEPVFGNIAYCKRLNRFTLRTKLKVNIQWQLFCLVHNIEKISHVMA